MMVDHRIVSSCVAAALLFTASTGLAAMSVEQVPNPRDRGAWVADTIDVIPSSIEQKINARLDDLERDLGVEVAVVTVEQVDAPTPRDFATELFNHWGVGKASSDNGLLVLLVRSERRLEMETGYGMEAVLTDGWLKGMQQDKMVPHFKDGDFGRGLQAGVRASDRRIRKYPEGIGEGASSFEPPEKRGFPWTFWAFLAAFGGLGAFAGHRWYSRRRERTCPDCEIEMSMLSETEDDEELTPGQQTEEAIEAVDYRVYNCPECDFDRIVRDALWFSGYDPCLRCDHRTLDTQTETTEEATTTSTGTKRITKTCAHCEYENIFTRTIPRKSSSSSTGTGGSSFGGGGGVGGGGGGSFGGGSSGGGGAGSSW